VPPRPLLNKLRLFRPIVVSLCLNMSVAKNISVAKKIFVTPKIQARSMSAKVPDPVDKHVGSRLRMRRRMLRMTQRKLGYKLGLTFQQVHKYETGQNGLSAGRLQELSQLLQVPVPTSMALCRMPTTVASHRSHNMSWIFSLRRRIRIS
jgi:DNA-binding XRE family transcriptional regulator